MRGKQAIKHKLKPDSRYNSVLVAKFINYLMRDGKKSVAEKVVYGCFDIITEKLKKGQINGDYKDSLAIFDQAVKNVIPQLEIRGRRIGGGNYQIPYPVKGDRRYFLAFHWIITYADKHKGRPMANKLADEILSALNNEGDSIKKKNDVHRMAEANRAFAHFARF